MVSPTASKPASAPVIVSKTVSKTVSGAFAGVSARAFGGACPHTLIINDFSEPEETPEHNALQASTKRVAGDPEAALKLYVRD
jgi:hypothetical protein